MQMTCALEPRGENRPGARSRPSRRPSPRETRPRAGAREEGTRLSQHRGPRCLDRRTRCQGRAGLSLACGFDSKKGPRPVKDNHVQRSGSQLYLSREGRHRGDPTHIQGPEGLLGNRGCPLPAAQR